MNNTTSRMIWDFIQKLEERHIEVTMTYLATIVFAINMLAECLISYCRNRNIPKPPKKLQETAEQKRQRVDKAKKQSQHECSICLGPAEFAVVTDCGHVFCCRCIIEYWQHSKPIVKPVDCAICRTEIFELNPLKFVEDHDLLWESNQKINDYNRRFSKNRKIIDYLRDFPIWAPYLIRQFLKNDTLTLMFHFRVFILFVILFISSWLAENPIISCFYDCVGYFDNFLGAFIFFRYLRSYLNRREAGRVINLDQI